MSDPYSHQKRYFRTKKGRAKLKEAAKRYLAKEETKLRRRIAERKRYWRKKLEKEE